MNKEILKGCVHRLDKVYSVIMTYGGKQSKDYLDKIDDIQNHLEEIL